MAQVARPLIIAHRGSSQESPENTLSAFERAIREDVDGIELDVWKCASGEIVVTHDQNLKRITGIDELVGNLSLSQLRRLDFGAYKGNQFWSEKIPTLAEALDLIKNVRLINIEIKGKNIQSDGIERGVIHDVRFFNVFDRCLVSSFNPIILYRLKRIAPLLRTGLIFYEGSSVPMRRAWFASLLRPYSLHPSLSLLNEPLIRRAHKKNQKVIAWTINHIHDLDKCLRYGIDGIITDRPKWLIETMRKLCP